jgi:multidrug efflux pump subunit AcrA (membrane-fusion protein)
MVRQCREDGVIMATRVLDVAPPCNEVLRSLLVRGGDHVKKGDTLAQFDTTRFDRDIRVLEAQERATSLRLEFLLRQRKTVQPLQAQGHLAEARHTQTEARENLAIQQELTTAGLAPSNSLARALGQLESAKLRVKLTEEQIREMQDHDISPEIAEIRASLTRTGVELDRLKELRAKCTVTAPFDGTIMMISEIVRSVNAPLEDLDLRPASYGTPLLSIADISKVRVMASFFENDVAELRVGQRAVITASHVSGRTMEGIVTAIGHVGKVHGRTSTLTVEVVVENQDELLTPGLTAQIRIVVGEKQNALAVPAECVFGSSESAFVWTLDKDNRKQKKAISIGLSDGDYVEVVSGLTEDDMVVVE